jgi:hypothetical protein
VAKLDESEKRGLASKFRARKLLKAEYGQSRNFVACTRFSSGLTSTTGCWRLVECVRGIDHAEGSLPLAEDLRERGEGVALDRDERVAIALVGIILGTTLAARGKTGRVGKTGTGFEIPRP